MIYYHSTSSMSLGDGKLVYWQHVDEENGMRKFLDRSGVFGYIGMNEHRGILINRDTVQYRIFEGAVTHAPHVLVRLYILRSSSFLDHPWKCPFVARFSSTFIHPHGLTFMLFPAHTTHSFGFTDNPPSLCQSTCTTSSSIGRYPPKSGKNAYNGA